MEKELYEESCRDFSEMLSSSAPVPGGGAASALIGALAVSLCRMSAELSRGVKNSDEANLGLSEISRAAGKLREEFLGLIKKDAEGFAPLQRAYCLKKDDPERKEVLTKASLEACQAPLEMLHCCRDTVILLEHMLKLSKPLLISDVGCAAAACEAAIKTAAMNVLVNTRTIKGDRDAARFNDEVRSALEVYIPRVRAVTARCMEKLER